MRRLRLRRVEDVDGRPADGFDDVFSTDDGLVVRDSEGVVLPIGSGGAGSVTADQQAALDAADPPLDADHPPLTEGGGLPPQWTDGGNGDVTATVDDTSAVPFTIDLPVDQSGRAFRVRDSDGNTLFDVSATGTVTVSDAAGNNSFVLNTAGTFTAAGSVIGAGVRFSTTGGIDVVPSDSGADGIQLRGDHLVPADGAAMIRMFNPIGDMPDEFYGNDNPGQGTGDMTVNADLSDGAAFLLLKGATPDGTIVAARIPMIPGSYDVPKVAAHVANGSTVDQLRDALIAAGLMAAS